MIAQLHVSSVPLSISPLSSSLCTSLLPHCYLSSFCSYDEQTDEHRRRRMNAFVARFCHRSEVAASFDCARLYKRLVHCHWRSGCWRFTPRERSVLPLLRSSIKRFCLVTLLRPSDSSAHFVERGPLVSTVAASSRVAVAYYRGDAPVSPLGRRATLNATED